MDTEAGPPPSAFTAKTAAALGVLGGLSMLVGVVLGIPAVASGSGGTGLLTLIFATYLIYGILLLIGAVQLLRRKIPGLYILAGVSSVMALQTLAVLVLVPGTAGDFLARFILAALTAVLSLLPSTFRWCRHVPYGV
ncbi:hypothetical protein [Mycobacterium sp. DL99]|uniref:hypothetical protein n=1 Tax=Mycobacterium sp. DL99 TaxID=2528957 RepID=UPI0010811DF0|nr:hypothetical protein [Mycobacterium sp. DL99]